MKLISITRSDKVDKKYTAKFDSNSNVKKVHFGSKNSSTYIDHKDPAKKDAYLARHKVNENWNDPTSPGALSRYILWNKKTLNASIADYKKRFNM